MVFNFDQVQDAFQKFESWTSRCMVVTYLTLTAAFFFFANGYIYKWFLNVPWIVLGIVGITERPKFNELHTGAIQWGYYCSIRFTIQYFILYSIALKRGTDYTLDEILFWSLIVGALAKIRSGSPWAIFKSMLLFFGINFAIMIVNNTEELLNLFDNIMIQEEAGENREGDESNAADDESIFFAMDNANTTTGIYPDEL